MVFKILFWSMSGDLTNSVLIRRLSDSDCDANKDQGYDGDAEGCHKKATLLLCLCLQQSHTWSLGLVDQHIFASNINS